MFTNKKFWMDATERAVKTAAQIAVTFFIVGQTGLMDADWVQVGSVSAVAGIVSLLTSIASYGVGKEGSASVLPTADLPE